MTTEGVPTFRRGRYLITEHEGPVGEESWEERPLPDGGFELASHVRTNFPWPHEADVLIRVDADGAYERVEVRQHGEGVEPRRVRVVPTDELWGYEVTVGDAEPRTTAIPRSAGTAWDFPSPLFNTALLRHLRLDVGKERLVQALLIDPASLNVAQVKLGYARGPDVPDAATPVGRMPVRLYKHGNALTGYVQELWTDAADHVIRYPGGWRLLEAE